LVEGEWQNNETIEGRLGQARKPKTGMPFEEVFEQLKVLTNEVVE